MVLRWQETWPGAHLPSTCPAPAQHLCCQLDHFHCGHLARAEHQLHKGLKHGGVAGLWGLQGLQLCVAALAVARAVQILRCNIVVSDIPCS